MTARTQASGALRAVRLLGALTLLLSTGSFLLRDWSLLGGTPFYLQLLVTTLLVGGAGVACALLLRESKGARTFLTIALYAVPLNFAALGGLLYAAGGGGETSVPVALATTAAGVLLLVPVALFALASLARAHVWPLALALLGTSSLLLVPLRDPAFVGAALLAGVVAASLFDRFRLRGSAALRTLEGRLGRAVVFVPLMLLAARTVGYYDVPAGLAVAMLLALAWSLWTGSQHVELPAGRLVLEILSLAVGALACAFLPWVVDVEARWVPVLIGLPCAALCAAVGMFSTEGRGGFLGLAALAATIGSVTGLLYGLAPDAAAVALATGIVLVASGYAGRHGPAFVFGLAASAVALASQLVRVADLGLFQSWSTFAVLGSVAIICASLLERYGSALGCRLGRLRARFATERHHG